MATIAVIYLTISFMTLIEKQDQGFNQFFHQELNKSERLSLLQNRITVNHKRLTKLLLNLGKGEEYIYEHGVIIIDETDDIKNEISALKDLFKLNEEEKILFLVLEEHLEHYRNIITWSIEKTTVDLADAKNSLNTANFYFIEAMNHFSNLARLSLIKNDESFKKVQEYSISNLNAFLPTSALTIIIITFLGVYTFILSNRQIKTARQYSKELENIVAERTQDIVRANAELNISNQVKSDFLARMSHELRTPMNAIMGFNQLLMTDNRLNSDLKEFTNQVNEAGNELLKMIEDILHFQETESQNISADMQAVYINKTIKEVVEKYSEQAARNNVTINTIYSKHIVALVVPAGLTTVIDHLISNAIKYNHANGNVDIETFLENDNVIIKVSDSGVGIEEDQLDAIFMPFYKRDTQNTMVAGSGIGLSLCKNLLAGMHASISVTSIPGKGSVFTVKLQKANA